MAEMREITIPVRVDVEGLGDEQRTRIAALHAARGILAESGGDTADLFNIAEYIVTGEDPWQSTAPLSSSAATEEEAGA